LTPEVKAGSGVVLPDQRFAQKLLHEGLCREDPAIGEMPSNRLSIQERQGGMGVKEGPAVADGDVASAGYQLHGSFMEIFLYSWDTWS
jgi:hypothetical protein